MYFHVLLTFSPLVFGICSGANSDESPSNLIPCKQDWFHFGKKCYKVLGESKGLNWRQAAVNCSLGLGHLATIDSFELQEFITKFLLLKAQSDVWIGLHDRFIETEFTWEDGSDLNYTNWDQNQPSGTVGQEKEDCVEMRYDKFRTKMGTWNDEPCDREQSYICQVDESQDTFSRDPRLCSVEEGEGWKFYNSCYHVVAEKQSWEDAENYCVEKIDGHLVTIFDNKTESFLDFSFPNYTEYIWIGIKMRDQALQLWSSGWHVNYKNWDHEQKEFLAGTCGMMSKKGLWTVAPCFRELPFICETSKDKAPVLKKSPEGWQCPDLSKGWIDLGGERCYFFETGKALNWYEANYDCGRRGGLLTSIHSEAETHVLLPHLKNTQERVFMGFHRSLSRKEVFEWADGSDVDYLNWNSGEPNSKKEECGELWTTSMKWNDVPCDTSKGYICSAKKVPPEVTEINATAPSECACTKPSDMANISEAAYKDHACPSGLSTKTVVGIVVCILLVAFLTGVVVFVYYRNVFKRQRNNIIRSDISSFAQPSLCHISSEVILKPEEFECRM